MFSINEQVKIPQNYLCPITRQIMTDPVLASDGQTYQRESISEWLSRGNKQSPLQGLKLTHSILLDDLILRKIIREYQRKLPEELNKWHGEYNLHECILEKEEEFAKKRMFLFPSSLDCLYIEKNFKLGKNKKLKFSDNLDFIKNLQNLKLNDTQEPSYSKNLKNCINFTNVTKLLKSMSYQSDGCVGGILEHCDGNISCWTKETIELLEIRQNTALTDNLDESLENNLNFVKIKSHPFKAEGWTFAIKQKNGNIIYGSAYELTICDKNFKVIDSFTEQHHVYSLGNIENSLSSFAVGLQFGSIKIYEKIQTEKEIENEKETHKYSFKEYKYHSSYVSTLLHLPNQNLLLSGSGDKTIQVLNLNINSIESSDESYFSPSKNLPLTSTLTGHNHPVFTLVSLNEQKFASGCKGLIKIWNIKQAKTNTSIKFEFECLKNIIAHENTGFYISLHLLDCNFMVSHSYIDEFKIWDLRNYECLITYKEETGIYGLIVTENNKIITATKDKKVSLWQL